MSRYNNYKGRNARRQSARYFAMRYKEFQDEYNDLKDSLGASGLDGMPHGTTVGQPTERLAIRRDELLQKIRMIEDTAKEADGDFFRQILKYTTHGISFEYLANYDKLYLSKHTFQRRVNRFYDLLAEKI